MTRTPWTTLPDAAEHRHWDGVAADVAATLERDALDRDRANQQPDAELKLLKESGLATLLIPAQYGGGGGHWSTALRAVRILARADASIAQILSYHYCNHAGIVFFGAPQRWEHWFTASAEGRWLWGDSVNPVDPDLEYTPDGTGYRLNGFKRFSTGASTGDVTLVMGAEQGADRVLAAVVDHDRAGVQFQDDWDALGQRLSASGSVRFDNVAIAADDVLGVVGEEPYSTLVTPGVQLGFANLYLGIAEGALARARELTLARRGAWLLSSVEHYSRDPFVQRVFGELLARAAAAEALTDRWNTEYDRVIARGAEVTAEDRARVEIGIAKAKIVTTETALEVAHRVFEVTGSSSARSEVGLDLFWRNIRTHSLHDPVDYKKLEVGANYLTGDVQPITLYT
ncbi:acyl-CoA dehydrogenase type 2 [Mycolicibacterium phlei]|jgi:alkylation response protein AidB-like acyl-CoA dehydrogenase|uniref:Dibenzothiophene monooxygenase n=1 Tax=Mycolicibacterium phlei DSM 43239 = CCUG 21000 TaxID=1226750 RepID=A0A5N5UW63_MYCPH|nr:acyl-CoA dehydrogenase family protein [Mycolicibacterium phlei]VEG10153.1 acyl-CoA dehydrogenase type 2 [Mycobacteroides chelonae]AMO62048.1 Dibenzothiophene desulfurization enzyme C [Mycolicibacterium phlei]EID14208.1 acyl-CoA dehydrogenase type 2 [Mycolicibacterium phlei RIVM601174]KAB7753668.1 acyl-CoA dehydrogenase [Mycolicibacterium phlei DSM 43239 = CCUG 21000]KXW63159.1 acyl-CoA dehydrogenase [Mycolicibacterium phlei DSM 43070]